MGCIMVSLRIKLLWTIFLLGTALDVATTVYLANLYGVENEFSVSARAFMYAMGPSGVIVLSGIIVVVWGLWHIDRPRVRLALEAFMLVKMVAPINNLTLIISGVALVDVLGMPTLLLITMLITTVVLRAWSR